MDPGPPSVDAAKQIGDAGATAIAIGAVFASLPHLIVLMTVVWWCIRIYETLTFQRFLEWLRKRLSR
jgi:hypothetical protein